MGERRENRSLGDHNTRKIRKGRIKTSPPEPWAFTLRERGREPRAVPRISTPRRHSRRHGRRNVTATTLRRQAPAPLISRGLTPIPLTASTFWRKGHLADEQATADLQRRAYRTRWPGQSFDTSPLRRYGRLCANRWRGPRCPSPPDPRRKPRSDRPSAPSPRRPSRMRPSCRSCAYASPKTRLPAN